MLENTRNLRIKVDKTDILVGQRQNGDRCPIRSALARMGFHATKVPWDGQNGHIRFTDPDTDIRYEADIPPKAIIWLVRFDSGEMVEPLEFVIDLDKTVRWINPRRIPNMTQKREITTTRTKRTNIPTGKFRPITPLP